DISTTYIYDDLFDLNFAQLNDVIVISHNGYVQKTLTRASDLSWTFADALDNPYDRRVAGITGVRNSSGNKTYRYKVTFIDEDGVESLPGCEDSISITGITNSTTPTVTTLNPHDFQEGDTVLIDNVDGMTEVNGREFVVSVPANENSAITITGITTASPMVVTTSGNHGYSNGDVIKFTISSGMAELNTLEYGTV